MIINLSSFGVESPDSGVVGGHILSLGWLCILNSPLELNKIAGKCMNYTSYTINAFYVIACSSYIMILPKIKLLFTSHRAICSIFHKGLVKFIFIIKYCFVLLLLLISAAVINSNVTRKNMTSLIGCPIDILPNFPKPSIIEVMINV